jgi:hypothetical protein
MKWSICALILLVLIAWVLWPSKEHMTGQEVYNKSGGIVDDVYDKFREKVPDAHIVNYYDFKKLYKDGKYTPANIDTFL